MAYLLGFEGASMSDMTPQERAEFWRKRLVDHAMNYANPKEIRREAYKRLFVMDWRQMSQEQFKGECADLGHLWERSVGVDARAAIYDLQALGTGAKIPEEERRCLPPFETDILREALAAAEAECAAARKTLVRTSAGADAQRWGQFVTEMVGNDATRARLGLPKIGEGKQ